MAFLNKLWKFVNDLSNKNITNKLPKNIYSHNKELLSVMYATIKDVTKAIENFTLTLLLLKLEVYLM